MSKIKKLLPKGLFNSNNGNKEKSGGKLETDALPVTGEDDKNQNENPSPSTTNTPTVSTELTESVVRELSNPNYNSLTMANGEIGAIGGAINNNTMNVHNAQQQVVMQFTNANNLHFGSVYNYNGNVIAKSSSRKSSCTDDTDAIASGRRSTPRKTTSIVAMMQSQEEPNHRMLDTIATHLGEGWKQVMRDLGHSEGQIDQAIIDHQMHGNIKEVIYQLLLQWLRNADDGVGTMGHITTVLWETNHRDVVQRMKLIWKSETNRKKSS